MHVVVALAAESVLRRSKRILAGIDLYQSATPAMVSNPPVREAYEPRRVR
jgi:hypothetical protein